MFDMPAPFCFVLPLKPYIFAQNEVDESINAIIILDIVCRDMFTCRENPITRDWFFFTTFLLCFFLSSSYYWLILRQIRNQAIS